MRKNWIIWMVLFFQALVFHVNAQKVALGGLEADFFEQAAYYQRYEIRYPYQKTNDTLNKFGIFITGDDKCAGGVFAFHTSGYSRLHFNRDSLFREDTTDLTYHPFPHGRHYAIIANEGSSAVGRLWPPPPCVNGGCYDPESSPYTMNIKLTSKLLKHQPYRLIYFDATADTSEDNKNERAIGCNRGWDLPDYLMCGLSHATDTFAESIVDTLLVCMPSNDHWTRRVVDFIASDTFGYVGFRNYSEHYDSIQSRWNGLDHVQLYAYVGSSSTAISKCPDEILRLQLPQGANSYEWSVKAPYTTSRIIGPPQMYPYYDSLNQFKYYSIPTITTLNGDSLSFVDVKDSGWYWCTTYLTDSTYRMDSFYVSFGSPATGNMIGSYQQVFVCEGKAIPILSPRAYAEVYEWTTGDTTPQIQVSSEGVYIVKSTYVQCVSYDTFQVVFSQPIGIKEDTSICAGTSIALTASIANKYMWNTGDTIPIITVQDSGMYAVKRWITGACAELDTFVVQLLTNPATTYTDTAICSGTALLLQAESATRYQWNNGDTTQQIQVNDAGIYTVIKSIPPCKGTETYEVTTYPLPQITLADTTVCFDEATQVELDAGHFEKYLWEPIGETTRMVLIDKAQLYKLTVTDSNTCISSKAFAVKEACPYSLYVPNAFTPNNDGNNDVLVIQGNRIDTFHLMIIDRWGKIVFETNRIDHYWNGLNSADGVYVIFIEYVAQGIKDNYTGTVTVVR